MIVLNQINILLSYSEHQRRKQYLDEINQSIVDVGTIWKEKATTRAEFMEKKQFLLLKMIKRGSFKEKDPFLEFMFHKKGSRQLKTLAIIRKMHCLPVLFYDDLF